MAAPSFGLIATFDTAAGIYQAAQRVRDAGYRHWDCITPCPVHGLDGAMGVRRSLVPRFSLLGGMFGFTIGTVLIYYTGVIDYPLIVGGKPLFSPMFAFPVSYELTILLTAFFTIGGMFFLNRLPMHYHPVLKSELIVRGLDDKFLLFIETRDPKFDAEATKAFLSEVGGTGIAELEA